MKKVVFFALLVTMITSLSMAAELKKGMNELNLEGGYFDLDKAGKEYRLNLKWGYLMADGHELGPVFVYDKVNPDVGPSFDQGSIGAFYRYNWGTSGNWVPFVGAAALWNFGDLGDFYDYGLGVEAGVRFMPNEHASINFAGVYDRQMGSGGVSDQDSFGMRFGISIFFGK